MDGIKKCPFCGQDAKLLNEMKVVDNKAITTYKIKCAGCGVETPEYENNYSAYITWNNRAGEQK